MHLFPVDLSEIMFIKVRIYYIKMPRTYQVSRHIIIKGLHIEYHIIITTITSQNKFKLVAYFEKKC